MIRTRLLIAFAAAAAAVVLVATPGLAAQPAPAGWKGLSPGEQVEFTQRVPVNVVLVGYDKDRVGQAIRAALPASSEPVVRYPQFYGLEGRDLGLRFNYDYTVVDAPTSFEDAVFRRFASIASVTDRTIFQTDYNHQHANNRVVPKKVLTIDAPSAERILERAAGNRLGIDTATSYTVFLVNWYGRDDFRFHVYRKTDTVDPDTGYNFGTQRDSRAMIAWGGSSGRTWFYDLSAGPESWSGNWNVDDADVDGDGAADYRMPPVWEYASNGYRRPAKLGSDLGKVVRYVALNLLFTTSPLYDPMNTAPQPGGAKKVVFTMFEADPGSKGTDFLDLASSKQEWQDLEPYVPWKTDLNVVDPINPGSQRTLDIFAGLSDLQGCSAQYGDAFAQPFCYYDARRDKYLPASGKDYVEGVFGYNLTSSDDLGSQAGLLGYADDNWVDGTQSYVFEFDSPDIRDLGFGFTTTTTHEVGHHLGLSHPHDGYDPSTGLDYDAVGDFYYAWSGDESNTIMNYLGTSNGFGVFDHDNMGRYEFAGYLNWSNDLAGQLEGRSLSWAQHEALARADRLAAEAKAAFRAWHPTAAAGFARQAYELVGAVAADEGVSLGTRSTLSLRLTPTSTPRITEDPRPLDR
jgi:hypothetical protein